MRYVINGGNSLHGTVKLAGAKNAGFKAMIASLLASSPSQICDLGLVSEIDFARQVIISLGGKVSEINKDPHCLEVNPSDLNTFEIPQEVGKKSRSSTMYVGPLLKKFGKAILPVPTGDKIGVRPIDRHIEGLESLGAEVKFVDNRFIVEGQNLVGCRYRFKKNTHTGTETLLMCAVWAKGETILENAAAEPEVDDLIKLLNAMGGKITRIDERTIRIIGVDMLNGVKHAVMKDRIEAATFGCMAIGTKGDVTVVGADEKVLAAYLDKIGEIGGNWENVSNGIRFWYGGNLKAANVETAPYPGFMTDWQPMWTALMTQADGQSEIIEAVYENRFGHIEDLVKMGAKITKFKPNILNPNEFYNFNLADDNDGFHGIKISGPTVLNGCDLGVNDIRRGATILLAGLMANGVTTVVDDNDQIKRGYENLVGRLVNLGAVIR